MSAGCNGSCVDCSGACAKASGPKVEKESCRTCPNRQRCHGRSPDITRETVMRLVRDTVIEVVSEWKASGRL